MYKITLESFDIDETRSMIANSGLDSIKVVTVTDSYEFAG